MRLMNFSSTFTVLFLLSAACGSNSAIPTVEDEAAIADLFKKSAKMIQSPGTPDQKAEAYVLRISDDAVWMPPKSPKIEGKESIRLWARDFFSRYTMKIESQTEKTLDISGNLAMRRFKSVGKYIPLDGGEAIPYDQKYIDILRKEKDGSWKITHHMWNSNNSALTIW